MRGELKAICDMRLFNLLKKGKGTGTGTRSEVSNSVQGGLSK